MGPRAAGRLCFVTGLVGAAGALTLLAWPAQVPEGPVKYPFTTAGFDAAQVFFAVHHIGLMLGLVALATSAALQAARVGRTGAWVAVVGMALLSATEVLALRYADTSMDEANAGLLGSSYGISCSLVGLGAVVGGVAVLRSRAWSVWHRWTPLAIGVTEFVVLTPGMLGGFVAARLVIGFWMLTFAALGLALVAECTPASGNPERIATAAGSTPSMA